MASHEALFRISSAGYVVTKPPAVFLRSYGGVPCLILFAVLLLFTNMAWSQHYWDGGSILNRRWTTTGNWVGNDAPPVASGAQVFFDSNGTGEPSSILDATHALSRLGFSTSTNWVIEQDNAAVLNMSGSPSITKSGAGSATIQVPVNMNASSTWQVTDGDLNFANRVTVTNSGQVLTLSVSTGDTLRLMGEGAFNPPNDGNIFGEAVLGAGGITKTGGGLVYLVGAYSCNGPLTISQGTLQFDPMDGDWLTPVDHLNPVISSRPTVSVAAGATLNLGPNVGLLGALTGEGMVNVGRGYLDILVSSGTTTYDGDFTVSVATEDPPVLNVTGRGRILKSGSGIFVWAPPSSFDSIGGDVEVKTGTFRLSGGAGLTGGVSKLIMTGGSFDFNGVTDSIGSLSGSGNVALGNATVTMGGDNESTTYNGSISGTGGITKTGSGTMILGGSSSYSGSTTIQAGELQLAAANRIGNQSTLVVNGGVFRLGSTSSSTGYSETVGALSGGSGGLIDLRSGTLSVGANNIDSTYDGVITGTDGVLNKVGTGKLTLTGVNTHTGGTAVSAGIPEGNPERSFPGTLGNEGTVQFATVVIGGTSYPTGTVTGMYGGGLFRVMNGFFLTVRDAVNTGTLEVQSGGHVTAGSHDLSDLGRVNVLAGGKVDYETNASDQIGSLIGGGEVEMAGGTLSVGSDNTNFTITGSLTGSGGLTKVGTGTMTLSAAASVAYSQITVSGGGLVLDSGALNGSSVTQIVNNGQLNYAWPTNAESFQNVTGSGTVQKDGAGTLTLRGQVGSSGLFSVAGGKVVLGTGGGIGATTPVFIGSSSELDLNFKQLTIGRVSGSGVLRMNFGLLTVDDGGVDSTFSGPITGPGELTKTGVGTMTLSGVNDFATYNIAGFSLRIFGGVLQVASDASLGQAGTKMRINNGATFRATGSFATTRPLTVDSLHGFIDTGAHVLTWNADASGSGMLTKLGTGSLVLNGAFLHGGALDSTFISQGTVSIGASERLSDSGGVLINSTAQLLLNGFQETIGSLRGNGPVQLGTGGALRISGAHSTTYNGQVSGSGSVTKLGAGTTLTLSAQQLFTGSLAINGGTLALSSSERLPDTLDVSLGGGDATLSLGGSTETVDAITGPGTLSLAGGTLRFGADNSTFTLAASIVPGAVASTLRKLGGGEVTLSGSWTSGNVSLLIDAGSIVLGASDRIADSSPVVIAASTGLHLAGFAETVGPLSGSGQVTLGGGSLGVTVGSGSTTYGGVISGTGSLTKRGAGTWVLTSAQGYDGGTLVEGGALRALADHVLPFSSALTISSGAQFDLNSRFLMTGSLAGAGNLHLGTAGAQFFCGYNGSTTTFSGVISGGGTFTKSGSGILTLSGVQTYTGSFQIYGGTVAFQQPENLGSGSIYIDGGGLRWEPGNTSDISGRLAVFGFMGAAFDVPNVAQSVNFNSAISGGGQFVKKGAGTVIFNAPNTLTGGTVVEAGELVINADCSASAVGLQAGARLSGSGITGSLTSSGVISPGNSPGTLAVSGSAHLNGGTLHIEITGAGHDTLAVTGDLNLNGVALTVNYAPGSIKQPTYVIATYGGSLTGTFASVPPGFHVRYGQGELGNQITLERHAAAHYFDWAALFGLDPMTNGAMDFDADHDGIMNLLEFLLGGLPNQSDQHILPGMVVADENIVFTFQRNDFAELHGASLVVETGNSLGAWDQVTIGPSSGGQVSISENGSQPDTVTVTIPRAGNMRLFGRLRFNVLPLP